MRYPNSKEGVFVARPNRFIAEVEIDGKVEVCHVKNTGRCKELLVPGAKVYVNESDNLQRKTRYDLVGVYKGDKLFNIDSSAPNQVFGEWVVSSGYFGAPTLVKPECRYGNSRFDFYIETEGRKLFVETKGVTLEENGVLLFPDAPTQRGVKHINELIQAVRDGYEGYAAFVVQTEEARYFTPNRKTHPEFADALVHAEKNGVKILCLCCKVTEDEIAIQGNVKVCLDG